MMIYDKKDPKQVEPVNIPGACKSPFEYMERQKMARQLDRVNEAKKQNSDNINNLNQFTREQNINNLNNNFPR